MFRAAYRSSSGALTVFAASDLHTHVVTGRSPHAYVNQRLQIQLELLMMSDMPLKTCWAFNERWNNKFYYNVASCWLFLLNHVVMSTTWHLSANCLFRIKINSTLYLSNHYYLTVYKAILAVGGSYHWVLLKDILIVGAFLLIVACINACANLSLFKRNGTAHSCHTPLFHCRLETGTAHSWHTPLFLCRLETGTAHSCHTPLFLCRLEPRTAHSC